MKIRLSKKLGFVLSGALVLCGASGSAAVLIGTDRILGPSYKDINGLSCTTLETFKMRRGQAVWVRRFVTSDQSGDGMARVKTALRVARIVQQREKAGLVQVAVIDTSGPKDRADMRGRAIAAQVVYIPDPSKMPDGAPAANYSAYYMDGAPSAKGEFYGMRVDLPLEDIEHLEASLTDKADCLDPTAVAAEAAEAAKGEKKKPTTHGEAAEKPAGHGAAPASEGAEASAEENKGEEVAAKESGGLMTSITGMFGSKQEPETGGEGHGAKTDAKDAAGHDAASTPVGEDHGAQAEKPAKAAEAEKPAAEKSFFDQAKSMILGDASDKPAVPAQTEAKAEAGPEAKQAAAPPAEPASEPKTTAEGGKGWSKSDAADEVHAGGQPDAQPAPKTADNKPAAAQPEAKGSASSTNAADSAGAAWLEKFRAQQGAAATDGAKPGH
jgi:hypothetical protein